MPYDSTYMCNLKMNLPMKQKQIHRHREQTSSFQEGKDYGRDGVGGWGQQMQTTIYRMDKKQVLLYSTKNYIQYPMISHHGQEFKSVCVCVCVCVYLNCFAIQHKLTQHWKSTIILLKKNPKHIHIQNPNIYTHTGCGTHTHTHRWVTPNRK